jgi:hypothetical protein
MKPVNFQIKKYCEWLFFAGLLVITGSCSKKEKHDESLNEQVEITSNEMKPDGYFSEALNAFARNDFEHASSSIKMAIASMKKIAEVTPVSQQEEILNSIKELTELASNVASDKVEGIDELFFRESRKIACRLTHAYNGEFLF